MPTGMRARTNLSVIGLSVIIASVVLATAGVSLAGAPPPPSSLHNKPPPEPSEDMSEELRAQVDAIVVVATRGPADQGVSGSYEKNTYGLVGGVVAGHQAGRVRKQVGPVPVDMRIPGTAIPGSIIGGLVGGWQREVQQLRDALTEELVDAGSTPLTDDGLAMDVYSRLRRVPELNSKIVGPTTPLPEDSDAVLHVNFDGVSIDVQGGDATITTTAVASLRRINNNVQLYRTIAHYRDSDSLRNWTDDNNRLWHTYVNYARHYLGQEIAARVYNRIELPRSLTPKSTDTARADRKNPLHFVSKVGQPELAWAMQVTDVTGSPFEADTLDESATWYDVEIYDRDHLVLAEESITEPRYTVPMELNCGDYRWSVRPSWRTGETIRYGRWMRFPPSPGDSDEGGAELASHNGLVGRAASEAPAYTQDFSSLKIACGRR
ncbi:MAG TPA: hypothetical protein VKZ91_13040 [Woeseiaceae bacterium]|nr:hypothetical protein [Woeseiaceae bacterium]